MSHEPCPTCPWRRTSTVGGSDIPGFSITKMRGLLGTVGEGDDFRKIMACHYSAEGDEIPCLGYVAQEGDSNLWIRVLASWGRLDLVAIREAAEDLDLWPDFRSMLAAYEAEQG